MKIMITGGFGFIGSHLAESLLHDNNELILLTRNDSKKSNILPIFNQVNVDYVDITNARRLESSIERHKPDVIFHLAGQTSHKQSFENPIRDIDSNTKSTLIILEKIRQMKLDCRFILGSTFIVIGKPTKLPVNEESQCNPTTIYGTNKLSSEHYCRIYNNVYGLDTVSFRITNSFGPREQIIKDKNAINFLIYQAFSGQNVTIFNEGKFFRDLIYISDVISGLKKIMKKGQSGNLYWISSNKKTWFYQLGKWLTELTNAKVQYIKAPTYTKKVDVGNFLVDNSKLKRLGWTPRTSVKDGIQKTLKYFQTMEN